MTAYFNQFTNKEIPKILSPPAEINTFDLNLLFNMKLSALLILFSVSVLNSISQDTSLSFPGNSDTLRTVRNSLNFAQKPGKMTVYKDDRITTIEKFVRSGEESLEGVKIDGFRVLIFFDMSKSIAEQQKAHFMTLYPEHKAYMDYSAPNYRVRVGNFRTELEAEALKQELIGIFPTALVVADKIQLPELGPVVTGN